MGEGVFLGQLQAFLEIARLGNVTRAADTLFLTQPALTSRLKRLEEEIGATLLVRDRKGARLTDAGRAFLPYAERAVATMTDAQRVVVEVTRSATGELAAAATPTLSMYLLPSVISRFASANPSVRLSFHSAASEEILEMVLQGQVEFGLGRSLQHPDIENVPLYEEEYVLIINARHRLAGIGKITPEELARETLITMFRSASFREFVDAILRPAGRPQGGTIDVDNSEAGKRLLEECLGVGLMPRTAVERELSAGTLRQLEVAELPPMRRTMAVLRRRGAPERTLVQAFLSLVQAELKRTGRVPRAAKRSHRTRVRPALSRR